MIFPWSTALAVDPPHTNDCASCHITHSAPGVALGDVAGNANLCLSCHQSGGSASAKAFAEAHQSIPWPGLPGGTNAGGNSHRWDSGPAGRIQFLGGATTASTGTLWPGGALTGAYAKTYTITISTAGNAGTARFGWTATSPGGGSGAGVLTGTNVALNEGITVTFKNGAGTSFQLNDKWNLYVRTDLRLPTATAMLLRVTNNLIMCSTCHDEHSQTNAPFDSAAPAYAGTNTGAGRHFQRVNNNTEQMCQECHVNRDVTNAVAGSHPVGVALTNYTNSVFYKFTTNLPLEKVTGKVRCETCHDMHFAAATDGSLARMTNSTLCVQCHTLANTTTPAAHFNVATGVLWPGGQFGTNGSSCPTNTVVSDRGSCINCHPPHGWPDNLNPTNHFPLLMVERFDRFDDRTDPASAENLCYSCHGTNGPAVKKVQADFALTYHHPVNDTEQSAGRSVECRDCHEVHQALAGSHIYTNAATAFRNNIFSNAPALRGVSGVAFNYTGLTTNVALATNRFTWIPGTTGATNEYQICFKCHSSYSFGNYSVGTVTFTTNSTAVTGSGTTWAAGMAGMWIARSNDSAWYVITNWASATTVYISPPYQGATASGTNYVIRDFPPGVTPLYGTGTAAFTNGSSTVTGTGTAWAIGATNREGLLGAWIRRTNDIVNYRITNVVSATSLRITPPFAGASGPATNYIISLATDVAQEFSPLNKSGHPVITGLNYYSNSTAVGTPSLRGLQVAAMKNPWTNSVGTQTMMCSDCHDATTTNYVATAAQGPHGSAYPYMLRGPNATNWPNYLLSAFNTSWCANCHNNSAGQPHTLSNHTGQRCYACHIIVPHGGKMSRLIGDRDGTMPARYAYNNQPTNILVFSFTKTATGSYSSGNCRANCSSHTASSSATMENW
jgi:predicted CXXCH cytochrome family protein